MLFYPKVSVVSVPSEQAVSYQSSLDSRVVQ